MAEVLKNEARRRIENGEFFGFIALASLMAAQGHNRLFRTPLA